MKKSNLKINNSTDIKTILIVNDDGINAPGIKHLYDSVADLGDVWVVAPATEKSGVSHAFTFRTPLRADRSDWVKNQHGWGVHGTPVDAVKLAVRSILPRQPDLILSGINRGENTGVDLLYSGTVAAAMEGMIFGVPSIAFSIPTDDGADFSNAVNFVPIITKMVLEQGLPQGVFLNVNVPTCSKSLLKGVRITSQAPSKYVADVERLNDETGSDFYKMYYKKILTGDGEGTDFEAIRENFISVTPVHAKLTASNFILDLKEWKL